MSTKSKPKAPQLEQSEPIITASKWAALKRVVANCELEHVAADKLPPRLFEVFRMWLYSRTQEDMAAELGITRNTFADELKKAKRILWPRTAGGPASK